MGWVKASASSSCRLSVVDSLESEYSQSRVEELERHRSIAVECLVNFFRKARIIRKMQRLLLNVRYHPSLGSLGAQTQVKSLKPLHVIHFTQLSNVREKIITLGTRRKEE